MSFQYRYCGLVLDSELALPALISDASGQPADIEIRRQRLGRPPSNLARYGPNWAIGREEGWWWLGDKVRFRVLRHRIEVDDNTNERTLLQALLLEAPMVLAMLYRNEFCLIASAAIDAGIALAFSGASSSGRSAAAAQIAHHGGAIVCDSLARITFPEPGQAQLWPQGSGVLLWPDMIEKLSLPCEIGDPVRSELALRRLDLKAVTEPVPLEQIYWCNTDKGSFQFDSECTDTPPARRRFIRFSTVTAGRLWIEPSGKSLTHFQWCHQLASSCRFEIVPKKFIRWIQ